MQVRLSFQYLDFYNVGGKPCYQHERHGNTIRKNVSLHFNYCSLYKTAYQFKTRYCVSLLESMDAREPIALLNNHTQAHAIIRPVYFGSLVPL